MREPPIVNQQNVYSDQFGSSSGIPQFQSPQVDPGARRRMLTAFGVTFAILMISCGGLASWFYVTISSGSEMSAEYREHREPTGAQMQDEFIAMMNESAPQTNEDIEDFRGFLDSLNQVEDADDVIDYPRVVEEMQNSGLSVGINALTKAFWVDNIKGAVDLPALGDTNEIVGFEWLEEDEEARAVVASYSAWDNDPRIHLIYVTRASGDWKIYDSRDLLVPMSEAQYLAAYVAAPAGLDDNVSELGDELSEIYYNDEANQPERSLAAYRRRSYPSSMRAYADSITGDYLLLYDDADTLNQFCSELSDDSYAGSQRVKGRLALLEGDKQEAFRRAEKLIALVGWHPSAAIMAGEAADNNDQKQQAADWLERSVVIAPSHAITVETFFSIADLAQQSQLLSRLSEQPDAASRFIKLCENLSPEQLQTIGDVAEQFPSLAVALAYAKLLAIEPAEDAQRTTVIKLANQLLAAPEFEALLAEQSSDVEDTYASGPGYELWRRLMDASLAPGMLDQALAMSADRPEFLQQLRRKIAEEWYMDGDWSDILRVLRAEPDSGDDPAYDASIGIALSHLDRHSEAVAQLLPVVSKYRDQLLDFDSPPDYAYTVMDAVATAAVASDQIQQLTEAIDDAETSFVVIAAHMQSEKHYPKLETLIAWYAESEAPQLWRHYYEGQLHYARGAWEEADASMAKAIDLGNADERLDDYSLRSIVYDFAPYTDYISEWEDERVSIAYRCGQLMEFVRRVRELPEFESQYAYQLGYLIDHQTPPGEIREFSQLLAGSDDEHLKRRSKTLLRDLAVSTGDFRSAVSYAIAASEMQPKGSYYGNQDIAAAVRLIVTYGQWDQASELAGLSTDSDDQHMLEALDALQRADEAQFMAALESYESEYRRRFWFSDPGIIAAMKRAGVWTAVNSRFPLDPEALMANFNATGAILLNQPAAEVLTELQAAFEQDSGPGTAIAPDDFPNAVGGWFVDLEQGRLVVIAYDSFAANVAEEVPELATPSIVGVVGIALIPLPGQTPPTKSLREMVVAVGKRLPSAQGYVDYDADSWFLTTQSSEAWTERLQASALHGIDRNSPKTRYFPWRDYGVEESEASDRRAIEVGLIREEMLVEAAENENQEVFILQKPSVLLPLLAPGDALE